MTIPTSTLWLRSLALAASVALAACSDNDSLPGDDHDHDHIETAGRLVYGQDSGSGWQAQIYDLDDRAVVGEFGMDHPITGIYASPGRRYAVVLQRAHDRVSFIDGGIWQEDHGDHLHDYKEDPLKLALELDGVRPTHYEAHDDLAALFYDGLAPDEAASVALFSDASLEAGELLASLTLPRYMHGTAEPRGDFLLTTFREEGAEGTLPSAVELYERHGDHFHFVERFEAGCPGLHGSFSNDNFSAFGCTEGVLVVAQDGEDFSAFKIANGEDMPEGSRIGTLTGHHGIDVFLGFAGSEVFVIDPQAATMTRIDWRDGSERARKTQAMDAHGERLLLLDDAGVLHIFDSENDWAVAASVPVLDGVPGSATIAVAQAGEVAFVTDAVNKSIVAVDLDSLAVSTVATLQFAPVGLAWVGLPEHDHDH